MRRSLIQADTVQALRILLAKRLQQDGEAVGLEAGPRPPRGLPRGGLHGGLEPVILVEGLDDLDRLHAVACEATLDGQVQTKATVSLTEDPHGLVGCRPS
jgi:hypothetical protein